MDRCTRCSLRELLFLGELEEDCGPKQGRDAVVVAGGRLKIAGRGGGAGLLAADWLRARLLTKGRASSGRDVLSLQGEGSE